MSSQQYYCLAINSCIRAKKNTSIKIQIHIWHMQAWIIPQLSHQVEQYFGGLTHLSGWRTTRKGTWRGSDWSKMLCFVGIWYHKLKSHPYLLCNHSESPSTKATLTCQLGATTMHIPFYSINLFSSCPSKKPSAFLFCHHNTLVFSKLKDFFVVVSQH